MGTPSAAPADTHSTTQRKTCHTGTHSAPQAQRRHHRHTATPSTCKPVKTGTQTSAAPATQTGTAKPCQTPSKAKIRRRDNPAPADQKKPVKTGFKGFI